MRVRSLASGCSVRLQLATILFALGTTWPAAQSVAADSATADTLEEVVVTAERREENVQKTPINITVVSGEDIQRQGLNNMQQILENMPGVNVQGQVRGFNPSIRGLGTDLPPGSAQGSVATESDSVYDIRAESGRIGYYDLARVEVLAGPQGTLYGVNADGGVFNVISNDPQIGTNAANGQLQIGTYNLVRGEGTFNLGISDTQALRFSAASINRSGYLDTGSSDENGQGARIKYLLKPNDNFSLLLGLENAKLGGRGAGSVNAYVNGDATRQFFNGNFVTVPTPWTSATSPFWSAQFAPGGGISDSDQRDDYRSNKYWANLNWNVGFANLQIIPSYKITRDNDIACGMGPCSAGGDPSYLYQRSQEGRLSSLAEQKVKWTVGYYRFQYAQKTIGGPGGPTGVTVSQTSTGVFADTTIPFSDTFRAVLGARHTKDDKAASNAAAPASFSHNDYRAGLQYDLRPQSMLYITYATGYRPGGFNSPGPGVPALYQNEEVKDIEVGIKNRFFNDRLQFNADVYSYDFKNYQLLDFYTTAGRFCNNNLNMGPPNFPPTYNLDAKNFGVDLSFSMLITGSDTVNAAVAYADSTFKSAQVISYNPIDSCAGYNADPTNTTGPFANQQVSVASYLLDGSVQPRSPKYSGSVSWDHKFVLGSGATLTTRPNVHFSDSYYVHPVEYNVSFQPSFVTYELSATYATADDKWSVSAWGRNLSNEAIKQSLNPVTLNEPRTYGVTISARL